MSRPFFLLFFSCYKSACMCLVFDKPEQGLDLMVLLHQLIHAVCQQAECCAWCLTSWNRAWVSQCCFIDTYVAVVTRQSSAVSMKWEHCAWCLTSWNRAWVSQCCFIDSYVVDVTRQPSAVSMKWEHCAQCLTSQNRAWVSQCCFIDLYVVDVTR